MSNSWSAVLRYDPIAPLRSSANRAISHFAYKDLIGKADGVREPLTDLPEVQRILRRQQRNGSWKYPGADKKSRSAENYNQIETYRNLGYLVEMFGFDRTSPTISSAANFLFRFQSSEGDLRGIYGNQYTPNYTGAILELLIKAGYTSDRHIERAFKWLASIRQHDGGWAIPARTHRRSLNAILTDPKTHLPDRSKPFSHLVTGVVLRAYAAHPKYRTSRIATEAGALLLSRLFAKDRYPDRAAAEYWLRFTFPFWFTDLISALDTLSRLGFSRDEPQIQKALRWFITHQSPSGLWKLKFLKNQSYDPDLWISLAISRIFVRMYG